MSQITYPSGRITGVNTKKDATAASVTLASAIVYQPLSRLVQSMSYGNGLSEATSHTLDYEIGRCQQFDGATTVADRSYGRGDALNLTSVTDLLIALPTRVPRAGRKRGRARPAADPTKESRRANQKAANSQTFGYSAANRLNAASGPYGSYSWTYDLVGNRTSEGKTPPGGSLSTDTYAYPATSNRIQTVTRAAATVRTLTYDNAGNILTDSGLAGSKTYTYNKRNRLGTATVGALGYAYTYNAPEQLAIRQQTAGPSPFLTHFVHDIFGNVIAETAGGGATGATGTVREYIWLPETEIAPTASSRTTIDRPLAVVANVNTVSPQTLWVSVDHLNRPVRMTTAAKASVWDATWQPWGGVQAITGSASLDARFPGQWFQAETGLHYNWHRSYDPTLGRYTQSDPLGFVDGPSVFGYAGGSPQRFVDRDGRFAQVLVLLCLRNPRACASAGTLVVGAALWLFKPSKTCWFPNQYNNESPSESDDMLIVLQLDQSLSTTPRGQAIMVVSKMLSVPVAMTT